MNTKEPPNQGAPAIAGSAVGTLLHSMARAATTQTPAPSPAPQPDGVPGVRPFSVRLSANNHARLKELAQASGVSIGATINATLSAALNSTSGDNQ